ncbi:MAG: threonine--tRNA ligase [Deltaproteobacteria bacterium]|jgi:threonyl-tRNA synthetase|nr:MAG: threonine--tRNA ligase [Deltaproteobacteria bacterium]
MDEVQITLPDGRVEVFPKGTTIKQVFEALGLKDSIIGAKVNGKVVDFWYELESDATVEPVSLDSPEGLYLIRHTAAHVMAEAVQKLFPGEVKVTIGPVIENGFYYDFDFPRGFTPEDLEKIESKMKEIVEENKPLVRKKVSREEAIRIFREAGETYKIEIINEIPPEEQITIYEQGDWFDLCRGPHAPSTGFVKAFKLLSVAGAYWRGDERNPMLQRIYGTAFSNERDLKEYLTRLEEAKKRDHRRIGKELDLFSIQDEIGPGLVLWHPKGARVRRVIEDFWRKEHERCGYDILFTPHIARLDLWKTSGHLDFYSEYMYPSMEVENTAYQLKPMTCPFHIMIYKSRIRSYRELPLRWAEIGTVYRYERSGVLHGLLRVRGFSQDDAHIFCRPDQIEEEVLGVLDLTVFFLRTFGFDDYEVYLSTRPEKFVGSEEEWDKATMALKNAIESKGLKYSVDEGGGAFYGPKIDLKIKDVLGRAWQCSTIQVDFNLPQRFEISFVGEDNLRHTPIMIHRAIFGSFERFFGILIEHYGGAFPLWLSPVQVRIATISDTHIGYAEEVYNILRQENLRVERDFRNEKLGLKVREAQLEKIPYLLVIGNKEVETKTVAPRRLGGKNLPSMKVEDFLRLIEKENNPYKWREVENYS